MTVRECRPRRADAARDEQEEVTAAHNAAAPDPYSFAARPSGPCWHATRDDSGEWHYRRCGARDLEPCREGDDDPPPDRDDPPPF